MQGSGGFNIFYATFSGTAEGFAQALLVEAVAEGVEARCKSLKGFVPDELRRLDNIVFIVATHYEGECPDDANEFRAWLFDPAADRSFLRGKRVALFGLGDRSYDHFNQFAKDIEAYLRAERAEFLCAPGFGDDERGNVEADFLPWKEGLLAVMRLASAGAGAAEPPAAVAYGVGRPFPGAEALTGRALANSCRKLCAARTARVVRVDDIREETTDLLRTFEVLLELPADDAYLTADNLILFLPNPPQRVADLLAHFALRADDRLFVNPAALAPSQKLPFADGSPAGFVLAEVLDLHGLLR